MSFVDEVRAAFKAKAPRRPDDPETDDEEIKASGVASQVRRGDSRLKGGLNSSNLSSDEWSRIKAYRKQRGS